MTRFKLERMGHLYVALEPIAYKTVDTPAGLSIEGLHPPIFTVYDSSRENVLGQYTHDEILALYPRHARRFRNIMYRWLYMTLEAEGEPTFKLGVREMGIF